MQALIQNLYSSHCKYIGMPYNVEGCKDGHQALVIVLEGGDDENASKETEIQVANELLY